MEFSFFSPTMWQTLAFLSVVLFVLIMVLKISRKSFPTLHSAIPISVLIVWMGIHVFLGGLEVLRSELMPPPLVIYMVATFGVAFAFSFSRFGAQVARRTPIYFLVGFHVFRIPLEFVLASLAANGNLPLEMTYHGYNFDIITGIGALFIVAFSRFREVPDVVLWVWNLMGLGFLAVIGTVAPLSSPVPFRIFDEGPPLVLAMFAPWNWIVSICVFFAIMGHLILLRALLIRKRDKQNA